MIRYLTLDDLDGLVKDGGVTFLYKEPREVPYCKLKITIKEKEHKYSHERKPKKKRFWNLGV